MMQITQINLNHCDTAQQLLWQSTIESKCDAAIIAELYQVPPENGNWVADVAAMAATHVIGRFPIQTVMQNLFEGFVIAKVNGVFVCIYYAPPRGTEDQYNRMLDALTNMLVGRRSVVIGGDFNAWAAGKPTQEDIVGFNDANDHLTSAHHNSSTVYLSRAIELCTDQRGPAAKRWQNEHDVNHKRFCTHLTVPSHARPNSRTIPNSLVCEATARTLDTHTEATFACTDTILIKLPANDASRYAVEKHRKRGKEMLG